MIGFFDLFCLLFFPFATMSRLLCCTGLVHLFALACTVKLHIFEKLFIIELISGICTTNEPDEIFRERSPVATRPAICCTLCSCVCLCALVCVCVISCCWIKRNGKPYRIWRWAHENTQNITSSDIGLRFANSLFMCVAINELSHWAWASRKNPIKNYKPN